MANIADTVHQLQKQINILECFCESYGMSVNLRKTKVVVFRRGGCLRKCEKWFYKGEQIECVNVYKYLGLLISCSLKWNKATEQLAQQANKALLKIYQLEKRCGGIPYTVYFNLFDKLVSPILCYGSEVWGFQTRDNVEVVHRKFCKRLLAVKRNTPSASVLGDCGRYPLMIMYYKRCVKYWLRLLDMPNDRLPKQCYLMSKNMSIAGFDTWAGKIKTLLDMYGMSFAWENQSVSNHDLFVNEFVQRVKDCYVQDWHSIICESS